MSHARWQRGLLGDQHLGIWRAEGDQAVDFQVTSEKTGRISFDAPAYKPLRALQSLLRAAWLLMDPQARHEFPHLLTWIKEAPPVPCYQLRYRLVGSLFEAIELTLWRRKQTGLGATVIVQFTIADTVLIWPVPEPDGRQVPCLLPPFQMAQTAPAASIQTIQSAEAELTDVRVTLDFTYEGRTSISGAYTPQNIQASASQMKRETPASLTIDDDAGNVSRAIDATLYLQHHDAFLWRFRIRSDSFAAFVDLSVHVKTGDADFKIHFLPDITSASDALATIDFFQDIATRRTLTIRARDQGVVLLKGEISVSGTLDGLQLGLSALARINRSFGTDLRYPRDPRAFDWDSAFELNEIVQGNDIEHGAGIVTMRTGDAAAVREALTSTAQPGSLLVQYEISTEEFEGMTLQLGPCGRTLVAARVAESDAGALDEVVVAYDNLIDRYARWSKAK